MIQIEHLTRRFGDLVAVDDLSLEIAPGQIFGLLGPNGAGKTTTIALLTGLLAPDQGRVTIDGGDPANPGVRRRLGVATQSLAIYDDLSAEANLKFFGRLYGLGGQELSARVDAVLDVAQLQDRRRSRVGGFSGGMKRRLNLAVALVHDPEIVICDEPTAGVDPQSRNAIFEAIEALARDGRTIIYTTHYMEEAQRLCHEVGIIDHGRLLAVDTVDALIRAHGGHSVLVIEGASGEERIKTDDPRRDLAPYLERDDVLGLRIERPHLETVFLELTGRSLRDS